MLRAQRPQLQPLELDGIKLRAMSGARRSTQSTPSRQKGFFMRTRLATFLTVGALALSGGTAAACFIDFGGGYGGFFGGGSSSYWQYRPPCPTGWNMGFNGKCAKAPPTFFWYWVFHQFCWIPNNHGGFTWGYGNGWVVAE